MEKFYVLIDVSKKQEYIFKSNKLKDNITNSYIIKNITEYTDDENNQKTNDNELNLDNYIEKKTIKAKKECCGGGNSIISFEDEKEAIKFIKDYSKEIYIKYPDLEVYLACENFEKFDMDKRKKLIEKVDELKEKRRSRFRKISFGVERLDQETGYPIEINVDEEKVDYAKKAKKELEEKYGVKGNDNIKVTYELDDYKNREESSYIGVISIDGNKMGKLVQGISDIDSYKDFTKEIQRIYDESVKQYLDDVREDLRKKLDNKSVYITPIVSAGDDLCIITEAEKAIYAAKEIVKNINKESKNNYTLEKIVEDNPELKDIFGDDLTLNASAGVVIIKAGYPFFDAYQSAEHICKRAKEFSNKFSNNNLHDISVIDWEIIQGSNISDYNFEEYVKKENEEYHIKPLIITDSESDEISGTISDKNLQHEYIAKEFKKYEDITTKIKKLFNNNEGSISKSSLHELQKYFYQGNDNYNLNIRLNSEKYQNLFDKVNEVYKAIENNDSNTSQENIEGQLNIENGVINIGNKKIYLLNDIIDSLKFFNPLNKNEESGVKS